MARHLLVLMLLVILTGCSTPATEPVLAIEPGGYEAAFDAAVEAARENGLAPSLRDRWAGLIETNPAPAPSLLEPWDQDGSTLGRRLEQTVSYQRRVARFEFTPAGFQPPPPPPPPETGHRAADGPDVLGLRAAMPNLTADDQPLELRVWVYLEQAHYPGVRRDAWTRRASSRSRIIDEAGTELPRTFWTPVARDHAFEQRLLNSVRMRLAEEESTAPQTAAR